MTMLEEEVKRTALEDSSSNLMVVLLVFLRLFLVLLLETRENRKFEFFYANSCKTCVLLS